MVDRRPHLLVLVLVLVAFAGCATTSRGVRPMQVADHAGELVQAGTAIVPGEQGDVVVRADEEVAVRLRDVDGVERPARVTVRLLVEGCVSDVTSPGCLAARAIDDPVVVRRKTRLDPDQVVGAIALAGLGGFVGWCTVACEDPDRELKQGAMIGGGVVVGIGALFALIIMTGGGG